MDDPYILREKQICTWLLCWKNNPDIRKSINKNIAVKISQLIQVDMSDWCYWNGKQMHLAVWFRGPYEWIWLVKEETFGKAPCNICFRPCEYEEESPVCAIHGHQAKDSNRKECKDCKDCGIFGVCLPCSHVISASGKVIIPEEKYDINHPKLKEFTMVDHICFNCGIHFKQNKNDRVYFAAACSDKCYYMLEEDEKSEEIVQYQMKYKEKWQEEYLKRFSH